ncbi:hypothetical protein JCM24511_06190 [Saitozyma sp. JCM 24511]|nr:hypothetical protein JCM24511_06190 [Saitozyma sp. JCM 24511]
MSSSPYEEKDIVQHAETTTPPSDSIDPASKGEVHTVRNAELYEALKESEIRRWSKESIHLYFSVFVAFLCACANGYDGTLLTGILSMPHFQSTFKTGVDGPKVSLIACLYTVGQMTGAPLAAFISDKWGRRRGMMIGAWLVIIGMIIAVAGESIVSFAIGRFVLGFGITVTCVAAPAYCMEIAPPHWRGRCTGLYNCGWFGGSIPAALVTFGTNYMDNNFSWRLPLILQAFACGIVVFAVWFIPESPRFLFLNGRREEAYEFLARYHGGGNPNSKLVLLEIAEFEEGIALNGSDKRWWDYRPLFATSNSRWRILQVIMMSVSGQYSGNGLAYFNTVIYATLGVKTVTKQLGYNVLYSVLSAIGALTGALLTDKMPRRKVLVLGTFACSAWLGIQAGIQTVMDQRGPDNVSPSLAAGALSAYFLFSTNYMFTYTPLQTVIPAEALETTMRAKGLALSNVITGAMGFLNQFAGPIALGNIGYKYIFVFVAWDFCEAILWYLFGVEAQGRTLEELEWVYEQPNPVKASLQFDKVVVRSDGTVGARL